MPFLYIPIGPFHPIEKLIYKQQQQKQTNMTKKVLVVGAGPSGLLAGSELLRKGIDVKIIDQVRKY